jgi:hypothetical protein
VTVADLIRELKARVDAEVRAWAFAREIAPSIRNADLVIVIRDGKVEKSDLLLKGDRFVGSS